MGGAAGTMARQVPWMGAQCRLPVQGVDTLVQRVATEFQPRLSFLAPRPAATSKTNGAFCSVLF